MTTDQNDTDACTHSGMDFKERVLEIHQIDHAGETRCRHERSLDAAFEAAECAASRTCDPVEALASLLIASRVLIQAACGQDNERKQDLLVLAMNLSNDVGLGDGIGPTALGVA